MIERNTSIIPSKRIFFNDEQRAEFLEAIVPYVLAAREAYQPIQEINDQLRILDTEQRTIEAEVRAHATEVEDHPLSAALIAINLTKEELQRSAASPEPKEEFRLRANELIVEINRLKSKAALDASVVNAGATSLIGRSQISPPEKKNKFVRNDSPVRPHNALGTLSIYREKAVRHDLATAIESHSKNLMAISVTATDVSLAMVHLVPEHLVKMNRFTPTDWRSPGALGREIVEISYMVGKYDAGLLQPPSDEEFGSPSRQQDKYIVLHLRSLLAHFLRDELTIPNRSETQLQDLYQDLSNYVRRAARHITPMGGHISNSYERIGSIIENLPGIEGTMMAARLSTNLYQDLGLPCLDYIGEIRLAEVIRNVSSTISFQPGNYKDMVAAGYRMPYQKRMLFVKIIDSITNRLEDGVDEIDCQKLFSAIEDLDYGEQIMQNLFRIADEDQQDVLLGALRETNCFSSILKDLRKNKDFQDLDFDE